MPGPAPIGPIRAIVRTSPEAPAEVIHGGPANPYHGQPGEAAEPYPWEAYAGSWGHPTGPLGAENELLGDTPDTMTFAAGMLSDDPTADHTPYRTHAAPHITGVETTTGPDAAARRLAQSAEVHGISTNAGASRLYDPTMLAQQDNWEHFYNVVPGEDMVPQIPGQVSAQANGFGVKDRTSNEYASRNKYGFDSSHRMRRYATGSVPGNYMWMRPGQRPMIKTLPGPARPAVGPGPFQGQDTSQPFNVEGAILQDSPTEYTAPPQPYVAATPTASPTDSANPIPLW